MTDFTHLHVHTQYSLLDGAARIDDLIAHAKALGMDSLAITDHGVMYGIVDFYKACRREGIKPILGMEAYVAPNSMEDRDLRDYAHLILLAKNNTGLKNLFRLSSVAYTKGFYYKPRIDYDVLTEYHEGLICLSACLAGDIPQLLLAGLYDDALALAKRLQGVFGEDFYIELQNHGLSEQIRILPDLAKIAKELGIKTVATNDIHYVERDDAKYQDVLLCVQTGRYVDDQDRMRMHADEFYMKSGDEMARLFGEYPESIETTREIADKCDTSLEFGVRHMPVFEAPDGMKNADYLRKLCMEGMEYRHLSGDETAGKRLDYELSVIDSMGFSDYFLIVHDFINYARQHEIAVGPGRGSGVGSLVAYCLRITDVNPLKYNLLFERLLNPERVSMPDIDVDLCIERRQEVIDYVTQKYGQDKVAQITTFGTMMAKAVIKDVGRAMRFSPDFTDKLASLVPQRLDITLKAALEESRELQSLVQSDPQVKKLIEYALKLEGLPRHASTHAAGVVIAPEPLTEFVPLQITKGVLTTQFTMTTIEEMGLLKMDFLGLRTVTVVRYAIDLIRANGKTPPNMDNMTYDDPNVFQMIANGDTAAVFQLESAGMKQFMTQLKPDCFEDLIAGISLYRPGPMERIPDYIRGKADKENVRYLDERLRPILEPTYGVMVYQEQVMQIVRDLAGYSMGRSDLVRRAMSKKKHDVMVEERRNFIYGIEENGEVTVPGAIRNGVPEKVAEQIFDEMMDFASYAFNKSHAAAYAVLAYKTAYLKYYYPREFMTAIMNSFLGNSEKVAEYVYFCKENGITILPPDINKSGSKFTTEGEAIRVGLAAIRNVGEAAVDGIIEEREKNGEFRDFFDFIKRSEGANKRMVETLIMAGAFVSTGAYRSQLMRVYDLAMDQAANERKQRDGGQLLLFDFGAEETQDQGPAIELPNCPEYDEKTLSNMEKYAVGLYLTKHPLNDYLHAMRFSTVRANDVMNADSTSKIKDGMEVSLLCVIHSVNRRKTKAGAIMATGSLEDLSGMAEYIVFPSTLTYCSDMLRADEIVFVRGKVSLNEERGNAIIIDKIMRPDEIEDPDKPRRLYLKFAPDRTDKRGEILEILKKYRGTVSVVFYDEAAGTKQMLENCTVSASAEMIDMLKMILGDDNVKLAVISNK